MRPARRAVRTVPRRRQRPPARPRRRRRPPRPRQLGRRAPRVRAAPLVPGRLGDPHVPARCLRQGDPLPAPRRGLADRVRDAAPRGSARRVASPGRPPAAAGALAALLPRARTCAARSSAPDRSAARATRTSRSGRRRSKARDSSPTWRSARERSCTSSTAAGMRSPMPRERRRSPTCSSPPEPSTSSSPSRSVPCVAATRADANRLANADHANLVRTSRAAHAQLEAVRRLEADGVLDGLSQELQEVASLRLRHPTLSIAELARRCKPPRRRPPRTGGCAASRRSQSADAGDTTCKTPSAFRDY